MPGKDLEAFPRPKPQSELSKGRHRDCTASPFCSRLQVEAMPQKPCNPPQAGCGARHHKHRRVSAPVPWHSCLQRHDTQAEATVPVFQRHGLQRIEYVWWTSISRSPQDPRHSSTVTDVQRGTANTVVSVWHSCPRGFEPWIQSPEC